MHGKTRARLELTVVEKTHAFCRPGSDLLSQVLRHSTIGAEEFNGRVRDGIGFRLLAKATRPTERMCCKQFMTRFCHTLCVWTLYIITIKPIERLVLVSSMGHPTYTPSLSTWSSSTALKGELVLRGVSRLDAFSGYPFRT